MTDMRPGDLISPTDVIARLRISTKAQLLKELARRASALVELDENIIHKALLDRENLGSTGVGGGVALPHARLRGLTHVAGMLITLDRPIDYGSIDESPVDIVFMLLLPDNPDGAANAALACVARRLRESGVANQLRKSKTADEAFRHFAA